MTLGVLTCMETFETIRFTVIGSPHPVPESDVVAAEKMLHCTFPSAGLLSLER
jgi:hypothetical protein